ncbi:MAG TPA: molybdenum cofactor biosynthesis protein MoaE [Parvularculaceae bacterium]|nr:molybdenum cofactor biosynthesis protein MoaE [Parvularculaceae bacterium]HNS86287.1 molybdenum cofactor biosynthesis protein MoaE [Parvularculaceae bacterium]
MILLSETPIDIGRLHADFASGLDDAGAIASFVGLVRRDGAAEVEALFLDHAPALTKPAIETALETAKARWPLIKALAVHRIGRVEVGDPIVFVATASAHRRAAFEACDFLMDFLKTDAPFWKKQICRSGEEWIEPRAEDYADRDRWR